MAPWMATTQEESIGTAEDIANQEGSCPTTPQKPSLVNFENYDAEGWYELEKQWATHIPGFVPEPPEGVEVPIVSGEGPIETAPLEAPDKTQINSDDNVTSPAEVDSDIQPTLDPRIAQILDLKARQGDDNVITRFLAQHGFTCTDCSDASGIHTDGLLAYLIEQDANTLESFSALLAEFRAIPRIVIPPDEDLTLYLHNNFFDYPYGAQWFWEECRTKDDNGLILSDNRFEANVLAFMVKYRLPCIDDVIRRVAQEHEARRPRPSALETCQVG